MNQHYFVQRIYSLSTIGENSLYSHILALSIIACNLVGSSASDNSNGFDTDQLYNSIYLFNTMRLLKKNMQAESSILYFNVS